MKPVTWRLYAPFQTQFYNKLLFKQDLTKLEKEVYRTFFIEIRRMVSECIVIKFLP